VTSFRLHENGGNSQNNERTKRRVITMTKSKHEKERQWNVRKQDQHPHGKVESFKELEDEGLTKGNK
jgi:hypothetical protein